MGKSIRRCYDCYKLTNNFVTVAYNGKGISRCLNCFKDFTNPFNRFTATAEEIQKLKRYVNLIRKQERGKWKQRFRVFVLREGKWYP